jgi:hypothetical protein
VGFKLITFLKPRTAPVFKRGRHFSEGLLSNWPVPVTELARSNGNWVYQDRSADVVIRLCAGLPRDRTPAEARHFLCSFNCADRVCSSPSLLLNGYRQLFPALERPGHEAEHTPPFPSWLEADQLYLFYFSQKTEPELASETCIVCRGRKCMMHLPCRELFASCGCFANWNSTFSRTVCCSWPSVSAAIRECRSAGPVLQKDSRTEK